MMQTIAVVVLLFLITWSLLRSIATLAQRRAHQPPAAVPSTRAQRAGGRAAAPTDAATHHPILVAASVSRAFPLAGLPPPVRESAGSLEQMLRQLHGVVTVYVSPVTALAYLEYLPGQVTEDQLVESIQRAGYRLDDTVARFNWRQAPALAVPVRPQPSRPVAHVAPTPRRRRATAAR